MRRRASRWLPWLFVAAAVVWLVAYPCSLWSLVPATIMAAATGTIGALRVWRAREDVFAAPAMIVVVYGICGLGAAGLWVVVVAFRCLGHGAID